MYITKYGCVFLKLGESIYVAIDLIPILLGSLPLAHNAQHSLVLVRMLRALNLVGAHAFEPFRHGAILAPYKPRFQASPVPCVFYLCAGGKHSSPFFECLPPTHN